MGGVQLRRISPSNLNLIRSLGRLELIIYKYGLSLDSKPLTRAQLGWAWIIEANPKFDDI